ncbi:hypothetical protein EVB81_140 [Rhizobium phage RHph_I46]|uniref:Uncharacterized protein n=1 Tax=Rhizobium phage RHph_I1_9 TaxID=2509729 RepID=A0A7S5RDP4_9CAUD|nr:hypothetical protein PP936_gp139 [Rhizobium phage RHph_I1_9]QIG69709.1 hypothetical protein EVB81_140 [Rhizobium phage RHph_I46]QIG70990.1 hypothetical protein EVB92_140 [Rhizobium phage RHph_I9]QIG73576.1 hypothetical protein EVC04_139 [Rhizobium phage RHph_I1_9]QIG76329.1 hypothetical protein EVC25_140 [Rhizobium phage RHph_I34]
MTKEVKLLVVEGLDRTGKDTLCERFHWDSDAVHIELNEFRDFPKHTYYDTTRQMMRSNKKSFVSAVTNAMAVTEFMQVLSFIKNYSDMGSNSFSVARLFPSTVVFDLVRGVEESRLDTLIAQIKKTFEEENDIKIDMHLLTLVTNKEEMLQRGSTEDSFEIVNYDTILDYFMEYTTDHSFSKTLFKKAFIFSVTGMSFDEVFESAWNFLFTD